MGGALLDRRCVPGNKGRPWLWSEPARVGHGCKGWGGGALLDRRRCVPGNKGRPWLWSEPARVWLNMVGGSTAR